jgi:hypothetical protein
MSHIGSLGPSCDPQQTPILFCESQNKGASAISNDGENGDVESATRVFLLQYASPLLNLRDALHYSQVPNINDEYPCAPWMRVKQKTLEHFDGRLVFFVKVDYEIPPIDDFDEDPTNKDWVVSTDIREEETVLEVDFNFTGFYKSGVEFKNSFGDLFDPPYIDTDYIHVLNMTKNFSTWDLDLEYSYENTVNADDIVLCGFNFPRHCLLCTRFTTSGKQQSTENEYYPGSLQFLYRKQRTLDSTDIGGYVDRSKRLGACDGVITGMDLVVPGWDVAIVDRGFNTKNKCDGGKHSRIYMGDGKEAEVAQNLDGRGVMLPINTGATYPPFYLPFQPKREADFDALKSLIGLPGVFP